MDDMPRKELTGLNYTHTCALSHIVAGLEELIEACVINNCRGVNKQKILDCTTTFNFTIMIITCIVSNGYAFHLNEGY